MSAMRALLAVALLVSAGCSSSGTGTLQLSWKFADGRSCNDAGAFTVLVDGIGQPFTCAAGQAPASVTATVARSGSVRVHALSGQSVELYRGTVSLDGLPIPVEGTDAGAASATVTLYATGAR